MNQHEKPWVFKLAEHKNYQSMAIDKGDLEADSEFSEKKQPPQWTDDSFDRFKREFTEKINLELAWNSEAKFDVAVLDDEIVIHTDSALLADELRNRQSDLLTWANSTVIELRKSKADGDGADDGGSGPPWIDRQPRFRRCKIKISLPSDTIGVALSGGGIRSASFCLGVVQALAKSNWLQHIDYLSTVSGGGYTGSFLGRYFDVERKFDNVSEALTKPHSPPIDWLRAHSNYLVPKGNGDWSFNLVYFWRNLLTLWFVLGILVFAIFGFANAISYYENSLLPSWSINIFDGVYNVTTILAPVSSGFAEQLPVQSPWLILGELLFWITVIPIGLAYWVVSEDRYEELLFYVLFAVLLLAFAVLLATNWPGCLIVFAAIIFWIQSTWRAIRRREGPGNPNEQFRLALSRNHLTTLLSFWGPVVLLILLIALIDYLGRYFALIFLTSGQSWPAFFGMVGGSATFVFLISFVRSIAGWMSLSQNKKPGPLSVLTKFPLIPNTVVFIFGIFLPLVAMAFATHLAFKLGQAWTVGVGAATVAALISFLIGRPRLISFVNRSSNLGIYAARLSRVFLGAVNPERHRHREGRNVGHVIKGDDVAYCDYQPFEGGGPLHLINVAVNETIDVASERGSRERQAENMAVGPVGVNVSRDYHATWDREHSNHDDQQHEVVRPIGDLTHVHPFLKSDRSHPAIECLSLREWMGISGAAFSPGMGRETSWARSILFTLTNLRLGYWWDSGIWGKERYLIHAQNGFFPAIRRFFYWAFSPQALILSELVARFGGPWERHWYLSDGGHFELTGAYELIRRRVPYMVVVDVGADEQQSGNVLGWLTTLVRTDFGAEIEEFDQCDAKNMIGGAFSKIAERFGTIEELFKKDKDPEKKYAALLKVKFAEAKPGDAWNERDVSWIVYIRAGLNGTETPDVRGYHSDNPEFPNENIVDQFFDDRQWESYRKLGEHIGVSLFNDAKK